MLSFGPKQSFSSSQGEDAFGRHENGNSIRRYGLLSCSNEETPPKGTPEPTAPDLEVARDLHVLGSQPGTRLNPNARAQTTKNQLENTSLDDLHL